MRCPHCHNRLLQKSANGVRVRIVGQVEIDGDGAHAQCYWCKSDVTVPLSLNAPDPTPPTERFVIPRK